MPKLTFYPIGNADSILVDLFDGRKLLFDYANVANPEDKSEKRIDLAKELRENLKEAKRDYLDVVAFTHADDDHVHKASEFFYLEHARKYQEGERIKIKELWVPAEMILEDGLEDDARSLRQEARFRMIKGEGIRVFSRPDALKKWLQEQRLSLESRLHLIYEAGKCIHEFSGDIEIFVHSPFSYKGDEGIIDRNNCSIVVQITFTVKSRITKCILGGDTEFDSWSEIVEITKKNHNNSRLEWDVFKIPHHCSYSSLSNEKGIMEIKPVPEVQWLLEQGHCYGIIVSPSDCIPNEDTDQPPHFQAANYYKNRAKSMEGYFVVTMEYPSESKPEKLVIQIDENGAGIEKKEIESTISVLTKQSPRAGRI